MVFRTGAGAGAVQMLILARVRIVHIENQFVPVRR